jgi:ABC-type Zn uptake system ZnuABC Zn-binding protein ZnuA
MRTEPMSEKVRIKYSYDMADELHAFYQINLVREFKTIAQEMMSMAPDRYDGYQFELGHFVDDKWVLDEVLSPERLAEIEKQIDESPAEVRQANLQKYMKKLQAIERTPEETIEAETAKFTLEVAKD